MFAIERLDDRGHYGEDRYSILGMMDGRLLYVTQTFREGVIRIISARDYDKPVMARRMTLYRYVASRLNPG